MTERLASEIGSLDQVHLSDPRRRWAHPLSVALTALGVAIGVYYLVLLGTGGGVDAHAYFLADPLSPYAHGAQIDHVDAYLYSPAFAQIIEPLRLLGWPMFVFGIRLLELAALVYVAGPLTPLAIFWPPVASELNAGNVHLLIAAAIVLGFRHPSAWAFVILTKVAPGVGLLWFAVRREWRSLRAALLLTTAIAAVSFAISPAAWFEWLSSLAFNAAHPISYGPFTPTTIPLIGRWPLAAIAIAAAARAGWTWVIPLATTFALPKVYVPSLSILSAAPRRLYLELRELRTKPAVSRAPLSPGLDDLRSTTRAMRDSAGSRLLS